MNYVSCASKNCFTLCVNNRGKTCIAGRAAHIWTYSQVLRTRLMQPNIRTYRPLKEQVSFHLTHDDWAQQVADAVYRDVAEDKNLKLGRRKSRWTPTEPKPIWLTNAGDSVLLKVFLRHKDLSLINWEPSLQYADHLQKLSDEYGSKFLWKAKSLSQQLSTLTRMINPTDETIRIVGHISHMSSHIPRLIHYSTPDEGNILSPGHIVQYLFVSGHEFRLIQDSDILWASRKYHRTALYRLFFDSQHILTIPMNAFNRHYRVTGGNDVSYDKENMYLMRICVRSDIFEKLSTTVELRRFVQLLKIVGRKKCNRVIPTMESWCPDIGLKLLEMGVGMLGRLKDVPLPMWFNIYEALRSSPVYDSSSLKVALDNLPTKWKRTPKEAEDEMEDDPPLQELKTVEVFKDS